MRSFRTLIFLLLIVAREQEENVGAQLTLFHCGIAGHFFKGTDDPVRGCELIHPQDVEDELRKNIEPRSKWVVAMSHQLLVPANLR